MKVGDLVKINNNYGIIIRYNKWILMFDILFAGMNSCMLFYEHELGVVKEEQKLM